MKDEKVVIDGGTVTIMVVDIIGGKVRLGFEAPDWVNIDREEIHTARIRKREKSLDRIPSGR